MFAEIVFAHDSSLAMAGLNGSLGQFILDLLYRKQARCKGISALRFFAKMEQKSRHSSLLFYIGQHHSVC